MKEVPVAKKQSLKKLDFQQDKQRKNTTLSGNTIYSQKSTNFLLSFKKNALKVDQDIETASSYYQPSQATTKTMETNKTIKEHHRVKQQQYIANKASGNLFNELTITPIIKGGGNRGVIDQQLDQRSIYQLGGIVNSLR